MIASEASRTPRVCHMGCNQIELMGNCCVALRSALSIDMVQHVCDGRGKIGALIDKGKASCQINVVIIDFNEFFLGKTRQRQKKTKE